MVELSPTVFKLRLVLKWRVGVETLAESGVGRLLCWTAVLKVRALASSWAERRSMSCSQILSVFLQDRGRDGAMLWSGGLIIPRPSFLWWGACASSILSGDQQHPAGDLWPVVLK